MSKNRFKKYIYIRKQHRKLIRSFCVSALMLIALITAIGVTAVSGPDRMEHGIVILNGTKILLDNNTAISYDAKGYDDNEEVIIIRDGKDSKLISNKFYVSKGDTIWDIAKDICPKNINIQYFVDCMYKVNNITDIYPGMELTIPVIK